MERAARAGSRRGIERRTSVSQLSGVSRGRRTRVCFSEQCVERDHGSAQTVGNQRAAKCARPGLGAATARPGRTRPFLQQPQRCVQKQEDKRTGASLPRLSNMLSQLAGREQRYGELIDIPTQLILRKFAARR